MLLNQLALAALSFLSWTVVAAPTAAKPFLTEIDSETWVIGNDVWNLTQGPYYATKLIYKNHDCVGNASGHYVDTHSGGKLKWTSAAITSTGTHNGTPYADIAFSSTEGDMHWVIFSGLHGAYQYFVNRALPRVGEFRSLWRLDNATFTRGKTYANDAELPPLSLYLPENKVQDETWLMPDGSGYITKYDLADWLKTQEYYGVYGDSFGSWFINPGKDYYNGDHVKQELMVHRESATGHAVQLNMLHGTHFQVSADDVFAPGKTWGPWLWYLNDGSIPDVESRTKQEYSAWPFEWFENDDYQSRGSVRGKLTLSDGRPASNAAVFLGDNHPNTTTLDMGPDYYYTSYADEEGSFHIKDVRSGVYGFQAWANGSSIGDVSTTFSQNDVQVQRDQATDLGDLEWQTTGKDKIFQIGKFDRYGYEFKHGGAPRQHGLVNECPADLVYKVGCSKPSEDWCFGQTYLGNWTIVFKIASLPDPVPETATLIVHLAGYSSGTSSLIWANDVQVGNLTSKASTGPLASEALQNEQCLYRSATAAGEYRHFEFDVPGDLLVQGRNEVRFEVIKYSRWHGFLWDSIRLEW